MTVRVGDRGTAESSLHPQGVIRVGGTRMGARAEYGSIEAGADVVVVGGNHLGLVVRPADAGPSQRLPDHGQRVETSFGARVAEGDDRGAADQLPSREARRRYCLVAGASSGAISATVGVVLLWGLVRDQSGHPWVVAATAVAAGAAWGVGVFRFLDGALQSLGETHRAITTVSGCLALAGGCVGAVVGVPWLGPGGGLVLAAASSLAAGLLAPVVVLIVGVAY